MTKHLTQTREAVKRYDEATTNLHNAISEQQEIDRRANEVGAQLVKNMDQLAKVKVDLKDLERKRSKQERLLKDINQVVFVFVCVCVCVCVCV